MKIGTKLTIIISIVMVVSLGITSILAFQKASGALYDIIGMYSLNRAEDNAELVANHVDHYSAIIEELTTDSVIQSMNWSAQRPLLEKKAERLGFIRMGVVNTSGILFITDEEIHNITETEYFSEALQGNTFVTDPEPSQDGNNLIITIGTPIKSQDGQIIGVLIGDLDYIAFNKIVSEIKVGKTGYGFMINNKGTTVAHPNTDLIFAKDNDFESVKTNPELEELVILEKKMAKGENGFGAYSYHGVEKYISYAPVEGTSWSLALSIEKTELYKQISVLKNILMIITGVVLVLVFLIVILITKHLIAKPIHKLVEISKQLAGGDVNVNVDTKATGEIGDLMKAYAELISNVKLQAEAMEKIAQGDLQTEVVPRSEKDVLAISMVSVTDTLRSLVQETDNMTKAAMEGQLQNRGNTDKFDGGYREIIEGFNRAFDAVIDPLKMVAEYMDRISKGDIPDI
ncbi:MAG: cache domain-containing protein, partial [Eubacteriales bacterium]|nr:cache domain-containing protein [Eubacteriales bacterium]